MYTRKYQGVWPWDFSECPLLLVRNRKKNGLSLKNYMNLLAKWTLLANFFKISLSFATTVRFHGAWWMCVSFICIWKPCIKSCVLCLEATGDQRPVLHQSEWRNNRINESRGRRGNRSVTGRAESCVTVQRKHPHSLDGWDKADPRPPWSTRDNW